ncbi:hypothetical protein [Nocardia sp. SSK8]|uniref:hypothetical protein n=1 Tax=Nocardia sp. SSK8 TaxID=3120154 RepID=UPI0030080040
MTDNKPRTDDSFRHAVRYGLAVLATAALICLITTIWAANRDACAAAETRLCDDAAKTAVLFAPALILLLGGLGAFVQTFRRFRADLPWRTWQGAGWFLLVLMTAYLAIGAASLPT